LLGGSTHFTLSFAVGGRLFVARVFLTSSQEFMSHTIKDYSLPSVPFGDVAARKHNKMPLTFDLHPLYAAILQDGAVVRQGEVLGLDVDLQRVFIAPFTGVVRLLTTGDGATRRVKVFLTETSATRTSGERFAGSGGARN